MAFLESPWPILSLGVSVEVLLLIVLLWTRRGVLLVWMFGAACVVGAGLLVEWLVVTDREAVCNAVNDGAAAAERNDLNRLLEHIAPSARSVRDDARRVMERAEITMVRIKDLRVRVQRDASPRKATALFTVVGQGNDRRGEMPYRAMICKAKVDFRKEGDRWLAVGYELEDLDLQKELRGGR
ncbi:MAG: hypothetical protein LLF97_12405 [Planctomycetaceae bacterium]|nr:hypothetical protein [Planctomycetaceae bacterium]